MATDETDNLSKHFAGDTFVSDVILRTYIILQVANNFFWPVIGCLLLGGSHIAGVIRADIKGKSYIERRCNEIEPLGGKYQRRPCRSERLYSMVARVAMADVRN